MPLTEEQQAKRAGKITASMLPTIMHGNEAALLQLYREQIGEIEREPPNYQMELGSWWEQFALNWNEKVNGNPITRRGEVVDHPHIPEFCCTLDGFREFDQSVIECKFLSPHWPKEEFLPHYYPQLLAQVRCTGAERGVFYVGQGTNDPVELEIIPDYAYEEVMWRRVEQFRQCLRTFTPPVPMIPIVPIDQWRSIDLTTGDLPNWGYAMLPMLELYEQTREAHEAHEQAGKDARGLVPDDVNIVIAPAHKLSRNKNGALSIRRKT